MSLRGRVSFLSAADAPLAFALTQHRCCSRSPARANPTFESRAPLCRVTKGCVVLCQRTRSAKAHVGDTVGAMALPLERLFSKQHCFTGFRVLCYLFEGSTHFASNYLNDFRTTRTTSYFALAKELASLLPHTANRVHPRRQRVSVPSGHRISAYIAGFTGARFISL